MAAAAALSFCQGQLAYEGQDSDGTKLSFSCSESSEGKYYAWRSQFEGEEVLVCGDKVFYAKTQYRPFLSRRVFVRPAGRFIGFLRCPLVLSKKFHIVEFDKNGKQASISLPSFRFGGGETLDKMDASVIEKGNGVQRSVTYSVRSNQSRLSCEATQSEFALLNGEQIPALSQEDYSINGKTFRFTWKLAKKSESSTVPSVEDFLAQGWTSKDGRTKTVVQETKDDLTYAFDFDPTSGKTYQSQSDESLKDAKQVEAVRKSEFYKTMGLIIFATSIASFGVFFKWRGVKK